MAKAIFLKMTFMIFFVSTAHAKETWNPRGNEASRKIAQDADETILDPVTSKAVFFSMLAQYRSGAKINFTRYGVGKGASTHLWGPESVSHIQQSEYVCAEMPWAGKLEYKCSFSKRNSDGVDAATKSAK